MIARLFPIGAVVLHLLLLGLAFFLLHTGRTGPIPPSPDQVIIFVNGEEVRDIYQPIRVQKGQFVQVKVEVRHQGQLVNSGEFTYYWCFDPPVNNNHLCKIDGYRAETNNDYRPETTQEQKLEITIQHHFLRRETVIVLFKPE
jgi:hypothetical protein